MPTTMISFQFHQIYCVLLQAETAAIQRATEFLEFHLHNMESPYTIALIAYALTLANSNQAIIARQNLYDMSIATKEEVYWTLRNTGFDDDDFLAFGDSKKQTGTILIR